MNKLGQTIKHLKWFTICVARSLDKNRFYCPNCGSSESIPVDSKFFVTHLMNCSNCQLQFRTPTDKVEDNYKYYQQQYSLGFTTDIPTPEALYSLLKSKFYNHEKSYTHIINILKFFYPQEAKVFDFGCSWGYGSWQLREAGFSVYSYEISQSRAVYAKQMLGIEIIDLSNPPVDVDIFFSNHVLEHVPSPSQTINLARKMLKPDGLFIAITPNGSHTYKNMDFSSWHMMWAQDHPNLLNEEFYQKEFENNPYIISPFPSDLQNISEWMNSDVKQNTFLLNTVELLIISLPNICLY